ncbi:MAG: hybrid sensor histidine kinase/response regulator, partial [Gammaproteobacteria bacterium]|nr:hybrid sensor histidine kinase/response regulator [Gammaproteobacteria bacterium]
MSEISLMALFREEVATHVATLTQGLLDAEAAGPDLAHSIEPLMRAAHSLKGAARVVELDTAVRVAHALEDALVAAQRHSLVLDSARIDALLRGVDWIAALGAVPEDELPGWLVAQAASTEGLIDTLTHLERLQHPAPEAPAADAEAPTHSASAPAAPEHVGEPAPPTAGAGTDEAADRAVKVDAEVVDRLLGLTSEAVVEAHRMEELSKALQPLRTRQARLADQLARLRTCSAAAGAEVLELAESAEALAEVVRGTLSRTLAEFDKVARRSALIAEQLFQWSVASRQRPFSDGTGAFPRLVRDLARELGKQVRFEIAGQDTRVDRDMLDKLEAPLRHLLQNAVDHGIENPDQRRAAGKAETGLLRLEAGHRGGALMITVADDGRGVDRAGLRHRIVEQSLTTAATAERLA